MKLREEGYYLAMFDNQQARDIARWLLEFHMETINPQKGMKRVSHKVFIHIKYAEFSKRKPSTYRRLKNHVLAWECGNAAMQCLKS